jgi:hypothetical protein
MLHSCLYVIVQVGEQNRQCADLDLDVKMPLLRERGGGAGVGVGYSD